MSDLREVGAEVSELLRATHLEAAIELMNAEVRNHPTDLQRRVVLVELLCVAGNLERADRLLDAQTTLDASSAPGAALFRQLIRAEQARQQFFAEGRAPEFQIKPDRIIELELRAGVLARAGDLAEAAAVLEERDASRIALTGDADDVPFDDFRDLDDLAAAHLEVFTPTGKYFWIPTSTVASIALRPPRRRRDLLWRQALLAVSNGPQGEVFLPAIYAGGESTVPERLGFETNFETPGEGLTVGSGLRSFMVGDQSKSILELGAVTFANSNPSSE